MKRLILLTFLSFLVFWPGYAISASKVGIVDGEKLFDEYQGAQDATKKISDAQDDLRNAITESEKVYTEFEKSQKSETEKLSKQKELQAKIDLKAKETKKVIESLSIKLEDDILQAIKQISSEKGLDVVFDKRAVLFGGVDITETVTEALKKKGSVLGQNEISDDVQKKKKKWKSHKNP